MFPTNRPAVSQALVSRLVVLHTPNQPHCTLVTAAEGLVRQGRRGRPADAAGGRRVASADGGRAARQTQSAAAAAAAAEQAPQEGWPAARTAAPRQEGRPPTTTHHSGNTFSLSVPAALRLRLQADDDPLPR